MKISVRSRGSFNNLEKLLKKSLGRDYMTILNYYGQLGVNALSANTPVKTGLTAASWRYEIVEEEGSISVTWHNDNVQQGYANIAILLNYGHGTRNGGYVQGRNFIDPALQPIFDDLAKSAWKEVVG